MNQHSPANRSPSSNSYYQLNSSSYNKERLSNQSNIVELQILGHDDSSQNSFLHEFLDDQSLFLAKLLKISENSMKLVKFYVAVIVFIVFAMWLKNEVSCTIPINFWLLVSIFLMLVEIGIKAYQIDQIDKIITYRHAPRAAISKIKIISLIELLCEIGQISWIFYGFLIFFSSQNACNQNNHNFAYIVMFLMLVFGIFLILKWIMRFLEIFYGIFQWIYLKITKKENTYSFWRRLVDPFFPEAVVYQENHQRSRVTEIQRALGYGIKNVYFRFNKARRSQIAKSDSQCAICLDDFDSSNPQRQVLSLPCDSQKRHMFHEDCLKKWLEKKRECPLCKGKIDPHRIENGDQRIRITHNSSHNYQYVI